MQWRKARRGKEGEVKPPANHKQKGGLGVVLRGWVLAFVRWKQRFRGQMERDRGH